VLLQVYSFPFPLSRHSSLLPPPVFSLTLLFVFPITAVLSRFSSLSLFFFFLFIFFIFSGIQHTGALEFAVKYLLRTPPNVHQAQLRMMVPVAIMSAFVNNTPIVAMMIPVVEQWCRTIRYPPLSVLLEEIEGEGMGMQESEER
jgi:hypothetical protein